MTKSELAQPELAAIEIHGMTRSSFILKGTLAAGAVYGTSVDGPFVSRALAADGGDVDILNYALTLEYLEAAFYDSALMQAGLSGDAKTLAQQFGGHEQEHVDALTATIKQLGGKPVQAPSVSFPLSDEASFLKLAQTLEDTGVSAYNGAAPMIESTEVLAAAGGIVQVEGRHAAAIRLLNDAQPAPDAFDKALAENAVLKAVKPFIES